MGGRSAGESFNVAWLEAHAPSPMPPPPLPQQLPQSRRLRPRVDRRRRAVVSRLGTLLGAPSVLAVPPSGAEAAAMMEWRLHFTGGCGGGGRAPRGGLPTPAMEEEDGGSEQVLAAQEAAIEAITGLRIHECDYGKVWETRGARGWAAPS